MLCKAYIEWVVEAGWQHLFPTPNSSYIHIIQVGQLVKSIVSPPFLHCSVLQESHRGGLGSPVVAPISFNFLG